MIRGLICALFTVVALGCGDAALAQPVAQTPAGSVRGEALDGVDVYRGIPYASPPTGWRRWRPPGEMRRWSGVRDATRFGPACHQPIGRNPTVYSPAEDPTMSEDCLFLNVWTPHVARDGTNKAPVFVWIHGGALVAGASNEAIYDGARMATSQGMLVVSINYRLGVLGYMAHPELSSESRRNVSGNYGLLDQIAALRWIKANIAAFGGDPDNVTIAGESAGGLSVLYLMASPQARGLFHRAIAQSSYMLSTPELRSSRHGGPTAEGLGLWLQSVVMRGNLAGMRAMDAQALTMAAAQAGYSPLGTIDGEVLPEQVAQIFDRGEQAPVPVLAGFNAGEIRSMRSLAPAVPADAATYETEIRARYGDLAEAFLRLYPSSDLPESILATPRDALYGWTAQRLARLQARLGQPAFLYYFDHGYPAADEARLHAFHASELPYVFGTRDRTPPRWPASPDTSVEQNLSEAMMSYWGSFARGEAPRAEGRPDWPAYGATQAYMAFEEDPVVRERLMPGMFELHEAVVCRRRVAGGVPWTLNFGVVSPPLPPASPNCP